jgi:hypothetical protein
MPATSASLVMSARTNAALPPFASIAWTVSRPDRSSMSATTTAAPSRARRSAIARPVSTAAPVTSATLSRTSTSNLPCPPSSSTIARRADGALTGLNALGPHVVGTARCLASTHSGRPVKGGPRGDEDRRSGESAWPAGAPVLPDRAPSGRQARLLAGRWTGVRQTWARGRIMPLLRLDG